MNVTKRNAISTIAIAIVIIVIVAGAGVAYYATSMTGGGSQTTSSKTSSSSTSHSSTSTSSSQGGNGGSTTTQSQSTTSLTSSTTSSTATTSTTLSSTASTSTTTSSTSPTTGTTSTTSTTSTTCTYSTSSTTTNSSIQFTILGNVVPLLQTLSNMTVKYSLMINSSSPTNMTASYQVASTSSSGGVTTYKVNVNTRFNATMVETIVAWVQSNGNVPEVEFSFGGYSYNQTTGAAETFLGLMTPFIVETTFVNEITTYTTGQFYQTGTSSATFGSLTIPLKVYGASNLPITMSGCGYTDVVHAFSMEYGTVPGTSLTLVTNIHVNATDTTAYGTSTDDTTIQIIWVSKA